eukprot:gene5345-6667_t
MITNSNSSFIINNSNFEFNNSSFVEDPELDSSYDDDTDSKSDHSVVESFISFNNNNNNGLDENDLKNIEKFYDDQHQQQQKEEEEKQKKQEQLENSEWSINSEEISMISNKNIQIFTNYQQTSGSIEEDYVDDQQLQQQKQKQQQQLELQRQQDIDRQGFSLSFSPMKYEDAEYSEELDLSEQGLDEFPDPNQFNNNYSILDLSHNAVTDIPFNSLPLMKSLQQLILFNNSLVSLPSSIETLVNLTILDLSHNNLKQLCREIGNLVNLRELYLSNNGLIQFPTTGNLLNLKKLLIENNQIETIPPESLESLTKLQTFDISSNLIQTLPSTISKLKSLKQLNISRNKLTELPLGFRHLTKLHKLSMDYNQIGVIHEKIMVNLCRLAKLTISNNKLKSFPYSVNHLGSLIELNLSQNQLETLPDSICFLTNLKKLNLNHNNIKTLPENIGFLTKLVDLQLYNNQLSCFPHSFLKCRSIREIGVDGNKLPSIYYLGIKAIRYHLKNPNSDLIDSFQFDESVSSFQPSTNPRKNWESNTELQKLQLNSNVFIRHLIGQGGFSQVFHGHWRGKEVAIKQIELQSYKSLDDFRREVGILSKLKAHVNLLHYYGACTQFPYCYIVTEFLPRGSLYDLLHKEGTRGLVKVDINLILMFSIGIALGCYHLSTCYDPPIFHTDLKSKNLLITDALNIKIADFGLASFGKRKDSHGVDVSRVTYAYYAAPEILNSKPFSEKSDVFSFGTILWELITNKIPFEGMDPYQVKELLKSGGRLEIPNNCHPKIILNLVK